MDPRPLKVDACPRPQELEIYAAKLLLGKRNEEILLHLKGCAPCLREVAKLTAVPMPDEIIRAGARPAWWRWLLRWVPRRPR